MSEEPLIIYAQAGQKPVCPTCGGPQVSIETFRRWTPTRDWEDNVQQLRCNNPKQSNKQTCPAIELVAGTVPTVAAAILSTLDPAPARKKKRRPASQILPAPIMPTHQRSNLIVRHCVDCEAPSKPMTRRKNAQEEWRCRQCYKNHMNRAYREAQKSPGELPSRLAGSGRGDVYLDLTHGPRNRPVRRSDRYEAGATPQVNGRA